ncbi:MAG: HTH-type transcriptional activator IlvY [Spirochaetaceae bacterium]|nr:MAG: HTH-type transcriptional activator IlvY [Spirochaetaceae bacterium]
MHIHELELFSALADNLHLRRAGEACGLSPSATSRALQRMEEELGEKLLYRESREVSLTMAGQRFSLFCRETLDAWKAVKADIGGAARGMAHGEVRIFASVTASIAILPDLLAGLRAEYPGVRVVLQTGAPAEALQRVAEGIADIAVAALPRKIPSGLTAVSLMTTSLELIAPQPIGEAHIDRLAELSARVLPADLAGLPMVLPRSGLAREHALRWFGAVSPRLYAEVSGSEAIISMVRLGFGVGVVPRIVLDSSALKADVRVLKADPPLENFELGLVAQTRRLHEPAVAALWNLRR